MKMFARVSFLASLGFAAILGCSASVGTFEGSGGSPTGAGGAVVGAGGDIVGAGGDIVGAGGAVVGAGGGIVGAGGAVVGAGGAPVGAGGDIAGAGGAPAGAGGAGDAGPGCSAASFTVSNMSYIDNGTFCGYAWTAGYDGGEIEPPCPDSGGSCFMGDICATANIPANDATEKVYPGVMIGWNVAQKSSGGTVGNFTGDFSSITPTFTTSGVTGEVRLVVQSGNTDYCATAKSGTAIPRSGFAKNCWDAAGSTPLPAGTPIKAILLQVNGSDAAQPNAEFCLTDLKVQ